MSGRGGGEEADLHRLVARSLSPRPPTLGYGGTQATPTVQLSFTNKAIPERRSEGASTTAVTLLKHVQEEDEEEALPASQRRRKRQPPSPGPKLSGTPERDRYYHKMGIVNTGSPVTSPKQVPDFSVVSGGREEEEEEEGGALVLDQVARWPRDRVGQKSRPFTYFGGTSGAGESGPNVVHGDARLTASSVPRSSNGLTLSHSDERLSSHLGSPGLGGGRGTREFPLKTPSQASWRAESSGTGEACGQQPSPPISLCNRTRASNSISASSPDSGYGNTPENGTGPSTRPMEKEGGEEVCLPPAAESGPGGTEGERGDHRMPPREGSGHENGGTARDQSSAWRHGAQGEVPVAADRPNDITPTLPLSALASLKVSEEVGGVVDPTPSSRALPFEDSSSEAFQHSFQSLSGSAHMPARSREAGKEWGEESPEVETPVEFGFRRRVSALGSSSGLSGSSPDLSSRRSLGGTESWKGRGTPGQGEDLFSHERNEEGRTAASSHHPSHSRPHSGTSSHPHTLTSSTREGSATPTFVVESPPPHTLPGSPQLRQGSEGVRGGGGGGEVVRGGGGGGERARSGGRERHFRDRMGHLDHQEKVDVLMARHRRRAYSQPVIHGPELLPSSLVSPSSSSALPPDEKDYFQVTDQLARENAHFGLSEALLSIIEQYRANLCEQALEETNPLNPLPSTFEGEGEGGEDMADYHTPLTQSDAHEGVGGVYGTSWGSEGSTSSLTNDFPVSPRPRRSHHSFLELIQSHSGDTSAESTAQHLLHHMATSLTGRHAGGCHDNEELSMSQLVLQLPTDFVNSLQRDEDLQKSITTSSAHLRGSKEWAPPRPQIIFHTKVPSRDLQKSLALQRYRCTGCGMKVDPALARHFRFCNYTGKYFCQNCHTNATCVVPAHVMERWSFKRVQVSNFARDLLAKIHQEPVFNVLNVNKNIYTMVPAMAQAKELRTQLISVKQYIRTCRQAQGLNLTFDGYAPWTTELHLYSMDNFVELRNGLKVKYLKALLTDAIQHIKSCLICNGKGFVCEFCKASDDILYPFEIKRVAVCKSCRCCFHKECFSKDCPRCMRMQERQKQRLAKITFDPGDEEDEEEEEEEEGEGGHVVISPPDSVNLL